MRDDPFESLIRRHVFEKEVATRMATYLADTGQTINLRHVLDFLGCPYVEWTGGSTAVKQSDPPHRENEMLVTRTLIQLLEAVVPIEGFFQSPENTFSILAGLSRHERWRECLGSIDSAYVLASSLVEFCLMSATSNAGARLRGDVVLNVRNILKHWINLDTPGREDPQPDVIAIAMFGHAWLNVAVGGDHPYFEIPDAIRAQRPPFLPGLVSVQVEAPEITLPALDTP